MNEGHNNNQQQQWEWPPTRAPPLTHLGFEIHIYSTIIKKRNRRKYINNMALSVQTDRLIIQGKHTTVAEKFKQKLINQIIHAFIFLVYTVNALSR